MNSGIMVLLLIIISFFLLSIILLLGKGAWLIAGYNTMPQEEKENYDEVALCKFMGKLMLFIVFSMLIMLYDAMYEVGWGFPLGTGLITIGIIGGLVYINTGDRFNKSTTKNKD